MTNPVDIRTLWWLAIAPLSGVVALAAAMLLPRSAARGSILIACLAIAVAVVVTVFVIAKRRGGLDHAAAGRAVLDGPGGDTGTALPARLPSAWGPRGLGTVWWTGFAAWLVLPFVLFVADTETPAEIQRIQQAGGEITEMEVSAAIAVEVESKPRGRRGWSPGYIAQQLEINVPDGRNVVVDTRTDTPIKAGDTVEVLYAADDPDAGVYIAPEYRDFWGAVPDPSGHRADLPRVLDGKPLSGFALACATLLWAGLVALPLLSWALGGRRAPLSTLADKTLATRGRHDGQFFRGDHGAVIEFRPDGVSKLKPRSKALEAALRDRSGWMCWDPAAYPTGPPDNTRACVAAFVLDNGRVIHGRAVFGVHDDPRQRGVTAGSARAPVDPARTVRVWSPRTIRPLLVNGFVAGCGLLAVGSLVGLLAGVSGLWSVLLAVLALLCLVFGWGGLAEPVEGQAAAER